MEQGIPIDSNPLAPGGVERRRHKRYRVKGETFAFFGEYTGTLIDISQSGLSVQCAVFEKEPIFPVDLDIFIADPHFYLPDIPFSLVGEQPTVPASIFSRLRIKRFSMQFGLLTRDQTVQLEHFIAANTLVDN